MNHYFLASSALEGPYCTAWSQKHFKTFDDNYYLFHGPCTYTLLTDCLTFSFHVYIENDISCGTPGIFPCERSVIIDNGMRDALLTIRPGPRVLLGNTTLNLPTIQNGLVIEAVAEDIIVTSGLGFKVQYHGSEDVIVYVTSEELRDNTCGLCGVYNDYADDDWRRPDGSLVNDPYQFGLSWKVTDNRGEMPHFLYTK